MLGAGGARRPGRGTCCASGGKLRRTPVDWLILAFLVWVALTTVTSVHWPTALFGKPRRYEGLLTFVNYAVIYFLVLQFADRAARVRRWRRRSSGRASSSPATALLQFIGRRPGRAGATLPFEANRAFSTYGNPDLLGGFLIFSRDGRPRRSRSSSSRPAWRLVYWAGFGLNGLALIVAFTRGAWIGGAVALVLLGVVAWRQRAPLRAHRLDPGRAFSAGLGVGHRLAQPLEPQRGHELRQASRLDLRVRRRQRPDAHRDLAGGARGDQGAARSSAGAPTPSASSSRSSSRSSTCATRAAVSVADNAHDYPLQLAAASASPACCCSTASSSGPACGRSRPCSGARTTRPADRARRLLGGRGGLPRAALLRRLGHRRHVPAVDRAGRGAGADRAARRGAGSAAGAPWRPSPPRAACCAGRRPTPASCLAADNVYMRVADSTRRARAHRQGEPGRRLCSPTARPTAGGSAWPTPTAMNLLPAGGRRGAAGG